MSAFEGAGLAISIVVLVFALLTAGTLVRIGRQYESKRIRASLDGTRSRAEALDGIAVIRFNKLYSGLNSRRASWCQSELEAALAAEPGGGKWWGHQK